MTGTQLSPLHCIPRISKLEFIGKSIHSFASGLQRRSWRLGQRQALPYGGVSDTAAINPQLCAGWRRGVRKFSVAL